MNPWAVLTMSFLTSLGLIAFAVRPLILAGAVALAGAGSIVAVLLA